MVTGPSLARQSAPGNRPRRAVTPAGQIEEHVQREIRDEVDHYGVRLSEAADGVPVS